MVVKTEGLLRLRVDLFRAMADKKMVIMKGALKNEVESWLWERERKGFYGQRRPSKSEA